MWGETPYAYFLQYVLVNNTITLKISRRPRSIAAVQIQVCSGVSECRFQTAWPGNPKAVLLMEATTTRKAQSKLMPVRSIAKVSSDTVMK